VETMMDSHMRLTCSTFNSTCCLLTCACTAAAQERGPPHLLTLLPVEGLPALMDPRGRPAIQHTEVRGGAAHRGEGGCSTNKHIDICGMSRC
jgi:hypothetical protein